MYGPVKMSSYQLSCFIGSFEGAGVDIIYWDVADQPAA
jgi:hypothetical protein